jgi:hypothetical protein
MLKGHGIRLKITETEVQELIRGARAVCGSHTAGRSIFESPEGFLAIARRDVVPLGADPRPGSTNTTGGGGSELNLSHEPDSDNQGQPDVARMEI